jgi:hypothetical protein
MADHILVTCSNPVCGRRLKAPLAQAGKRARCACGQVLLVPSFEMEPEPDDEPVTLLPARRRAPDRTPLLQNPVFWTIAGTAAALALVGLAVLFMVLQSSAPEFQSTVEKPGDPAPPPKPAPPEPVRFDGEWTGATGTDFWVAGISFDKNGFPCTGAVKIGTSGISISTPVNWTKSGDEIIGTDSRRPPAIGPVLARVRLLNGVLSGEAKVGEGALFVPSEFKKFTGFKRTGPPIVLEKPKPPEPKKTEEPPPVPKKVDPVPPKKEEPPPPPKKEPTPSTVEGKPDLALSEKIYDRLANSKRTITPFYSKNAEGKLEVKNAKSVGWNGPVAGWFSSIGWATSSSYSGLVDGAVFVNIGPHPVKADGFDIEKGECVVLRKGKLVKAELKELESPEPK